MVQEEDPGEDAMEGGTSETWWEVTPSFPWLQWSPRGVLVTAWAHHHHPLWKWLHSGPSPLDPLWKWLHSGPHPGVGSPSSRQNSRRRGRGPSRE